MLAQFVFDILIHMACSKKKIVIVGGRLKDLGSATVTFVAVMSSMVTHTKITVRGVVFLY